MSEEDKKAEIVETEHLGSRLSDVQKAISDRSRCRQCNGLIDQDELRFGKDSNQKRAFQCDDIDPRGKGDGGFYAQVSLTKWYHIDCLKLSQKARQQLLAQPSKLAGYTELRPADQQIITVLLAAPQAPPRRVQPKPTLTALQRRMAGRRR